MDNLWVMTRFSHPWGLTALWNGWAQPPPAAEIRHCPNERSPARREHPPPRQTPFRSPLLSWEGECRRGSANPNVRCRGLRAMIEGARFEGLSQPIAWRAGRLRRINIELVDTVERRAALYRPPNVVGPSVFIANELLETQDRSHLGKGPHRPLERRDPGIRDTIAIDTHLGIGGHVILSCPDEQSIRRLLQRRPARDHSL